MEITTEISKIRSLSLIFTASNFKKIVRKGDYYSTLYKLKKYTNVSESTTNLDAINLIYKTLLKNYKNEYVYKNILINKLLLKKYSLKNTIVLNEFNIGKSIADFVLLNGEARVYEIKTELDTLEKLSKQVLDYCKFGDKVYIVTNTKHINKLIEVYMDSPIGILELTSRNSLKTIKKAETNTSTFCHETLFKTLRKNEYLNLIEEYFGFIPKVPNTLIFRESLNLAKEIDILTFQKLVINKLKKRNILNTEIVKDESIPECLKHICYTLDFTRKEYKELDSFLNRNSKSCISHI